MSAKMGRVGGEAPAQSEAGGRSQERPLQDELNRLADVSASRGDTTTWGRV